MKNPLRKLHNWLRSLVVKKPKDAHLKEHRLKIIRIVNRIKQITEMKIVHKAVKWTPWDLDDKVLKFLLDYLPSVLNELTLSKQALHYFAIDDATETLKTIKKHTRGILYNKIAGKMYQISSGLEIDEAEKKIEEEYQAGKSNATPQDSEGEGE